MEFILQIERRRIFFKLIKVAETCLGHSALVWVTLTELCVSSAEGPAWHMLYYITHSLNYP